LSQSANVSVLREFSQSENVSVLREDHGEKWRTLGPRGAVERAVAVANWKKVVREDLADIQIFESVRRARGAVGMPVVAEIAVAAKVMMMTMMRKVGDLDRRLPNERWRQ